MRAFPAHAPALGLAILLVFAGSGVRGDGTGPERKMTGPEAEAFQQLRLTVQTALAQAPEGYDRKVTHVTDGNPGMMPQGIAPGQMLRMLFRATYTRREDAGAQGQSDLMERTKGTTEQQARMADLQSREAALMKARDQRGTGVDKDKIRAELKAVRAEENQLTDEIAAGLQAWIAAGGPAAADQERRQAQGPKEITVQVLVNGTVSVLDTATPYPIDGFPQAFAWTEGPDGTGNAGITVLVGPYVRSDKISGRDRYKLPEAAARVSTQPRGIALSVSGPADKPESLRALVRQTDFAKLQALLR